MCACRGMGAGVGQKKLKRGEVRVTRVCAVSVWCVCWGGGGYVCSH